MTESIYDARTVVSGAGNLVVPEADPAYLVHRAKLGDSTAWDALHTKYRSLVWAIARQVGLRESDAADAVQSTWLRLVEHIDDIRDPSRVGPWLATTVRREALRIVETHRRVVLHDDGVLDGPDRLLPASDERLLAQEDGARFRKAMLTLPPAWQSLLQLLLVDPPLSYREIGERLGVPVGSIGPTRMRCISRLQLEMESA